MHTQINEFHVPKSAQGEDFWLSIGLPSRGASLHETLHQGIPFHVYTKLVAISGLESKKLAKYLVIPPATLQRRAKAGRFKVDEGDRLYRFAEVYKCAIDLFEGDKEQARKWLLNPVRGLGGKHPADMISTSAGAEAVLDLIGRLEHGVFA
ncbi:DUF2384 domain-containing protein [Halomonas vilamensis]|uniref:DUF2384 domain-containing protein n=1 Tax=Vreelandella vilamensis TaxID=531309 RepID=A0ABU1H5K3_9GAMM|nr:antitoxin Xre/MbcA/ParS toxin-binding domain-containing protein [Halomonas vilamensis]MDR5899588.1 DUF2384 domain-containing protein [Halomonas vilamensis]